MDKEDIIISLDTWHSDTLRGHKVYFADAVVTALNQCADIDTNTHKESEI